MNTKAISDIVGWVLLIGLTVMLGAVVSQWMQEHAQETSAELVKDTENDLLCADTYFTASFDAACTNLTIINKGYHTIHSMKIRSSIGIATVMPFTPELLPGQTQPLNIADSSVDLIPVILSNNEQIGCADKKIHVTCGP